MLNGNQMAYALKDAGLINEVPHKRKKRGKQFRCHKCKSIMTKIDDTNVMCCPKCDKSFFIFSY